MTESSKSSSVPTSTSLVAQKVVARDDGTLAIDVDADGHRVRADMPVARGGNNSAPTPGALMRASVATCLAVGYKSWGEQLGVPIENVEIALSTEIDMRGQNGAQGVPPGWQRVQWHVKLSSSASNEEIERVLAHAERLSPMLNCLDARCERKRSFEKR